MTDPTPTLRALAERTGIVDDHGTLRWVFKPNQREVSSSGGDELTRWAGLLNQARYLINDMAKRAETAQALQREAIARVICVVEPLSSRACDIGTKSCIVDHRQHSAHASLVQEMEKYVQHLDSCASHDCKNCRADQEFGERHEYVKGDCDCGLAALLRRSAAPGTTESET